MTLEWAQPLSFTGKRSWRWEGAVVWRGEPVPVSVWHDSSAPQRGGSKPDAKLQAAIDKKLAAALTAVWPKRRAESTRLFARLRERAWPDAKPVTDASMGVPTVALPNGVRGRRVDLEFRACRVFGTKLFPLVVLDGELAAQLEPTRDANGNAAVRWDEARHRVPLKEAPPPPKLPQLPPRAKWKRAPLRWQNGKLLVRGVEARLRGDVDENTLGLAVGMYDAVMRIATEALARLHADGGWSSSPVSAMRVSAKLRLIEISLGGDRWTYSFRDGGLFGGHQVEVWIDGRDVEVDLAG